MMTDSTDTDRDCVREREKREEEERVYERVLR